MLIISTQCFPPAMGGIESLVYFLAREFNHAGKDVLVYADAGKEDADAEFDNEQLFQIIRDRGLKPLRRRSKARKIYLKSMSLKKSDPPVILVDTWKSLEHINSTYFCTVACLAHGSEFPGNPSRLKFRRIKKALDKADIIIANSTYTATLLEPYAGDCKIHVVSPGIDMPEINEISTQRVKSDLENNTPVLITVARLEKRKGHAQVIGLLPSLIKDYPTLLYIIIGNGPCRKNLEDLVTKNGLQKNVRFIGAMSGVEKHAYLSNSDIFIMPGVKVGDDVEGFGIAYIEAGYFGVPCIANDIGGVAEAVIHNHTGLVCAPGNTLELERSLHRLIKDGVLRNRLGTNAREKAISCLWNQKIEDYASLLFLP